ncbi:Vacuolar protein-sorting-associated protein 25 [Paramyrothecium foliicola]|nr:Vacuolar protein-sorting-associated protein 25 [Paramyrothecium foliicola]
MCEDHCRPPIFSSGKTEKFKAKRRLAVDCEAWERTGIAKALNSRQDYVLAIQNALMIMSKSYSMKIGYLRTATGTSVVTASEAIVYVAQIPQSRFGVRCQPPRDPRGFWNNSTCVIPPKPLQWNPSSVKRLRQSESGHSRSSTLIVKREPRRSSRRQHFPLTNQPTDQPTTLRLVLFPQQLIMTTATSATPPNGTGSPATAALSSAPANDDGSFSFPREYYFPAFYTRQTNLTTHHAQLTKWSALVLAYARHHRLFKLQLSAAADSDLFYNRKLDRRLQPADIRDLLDFMRKEGRAEYAAGAASGDVVFVYWRKPEEWAALVEAYVDETGQKGSVLTVYELNEGEGTRGTELHGMDNEVLLKALNIIVKRGKAQIFGQDDSLGVKFF